LSKGLYCPKCNGVEWKTERVSRVDKTIRRVRPCQQCGFRGLTKEQFLWQAAEEEGMQRFRDRIAARKLSCLF
jgi:transcriptional regulator NrdR family protein